MNRVELHFKIMALKSILKKIPYVSSFIRNMKWRVYRPFYIKCWTCYRRFEYQLKNSGIFGWNENEIKMKQIKNSHKNQIAFIIGNGPSLKSNDLDILKEKGIYCFGTNRINLIFEKTKWRPNCYLALDRLIYRDHDPTIPEMMKAQIDLYIFGEEAYHGLSNHYKCHDNVLYFKRKTNSYYLPVNEFSPDALKYVVDGFTVTYAAMQIAYYMGFKEIYLLGVDCNYSKRFLKNGNIINKEEENTYFDKRYDTKGSNSGYIDGMLEAYTTAKKFGDSNNFKIYNASRGGVLDVFERIDLDLLFTRL